MANILCLETSAGFCSVSVFNNDELIWNKEEKKERSHAQKLGGMVKEAIASLKGTKFDTVAVSSGPGSYTGLRIGVALAKGLCAGFGIPLISVPTLKIMLEAWRDSNDFREADFYVPMIDARRMDVYYSIFDRKFNGVIEDQDLILTDKSFENERKNGSCLFFGNGSEKFAELLGEDLGRNMIGGEANPLSKFMGNEAHGKFSSGDFEDLAYFEPKYVKDVFVTKPKPTFG